LGERQAGTALALSERMTSTSEPEDLEKASPSSALEVALGLAVAGAVCGLVALTQSASANAAREQPPLSPASALSDGSVASQESAARQAGTPPEASDSMDLALLLRQRSSTNTLIDEPR
jgi:hypothetical protein